MSVLSHGGESESELVPRALRLSSCTRSRPRNSSRSLTRQSRCSSPRQAAQNAWVEETRFPVEEIAVQYYDAVDVFLRRMRDNGLIDDRDEMRR